MNKECDYSAAYVILKTDTGLEGRGMTFSESSPTAPRSGRANERNSHWPR